VSAFWMTRMKTLAAKRNYTDRPHPGQPNAPLGRWGETLH
jgi:hypothetical protein